MFLVSVAVSIAIVSDSTSKSRASDSVVLSLKDIFRDPLFYCDFLIPTVVARTPVTSSGLEQLPIDYWC